MHSPTPTDTYPHPPTPTQKRSHSPTSINAQPKSFSKMKTPANIVKREYFSRIYHVMDTWHSFFQLCVGVCVGVTFLWLSVGGCDLFWLGVGGCGWVWPFLGWVWVGVGECDLFLAGRRWVWVSVGGCGWVHRV